MRRAKVSASIRPLFLSMFLVASTAFTPALHAQAPAAGTSIAVKVLDPVDSSHDPAGKQYRASVTTAVTTANGVAIAQGSAATVTLTSNGSGYTTQLVSVMVNGQTVAVTSNSASVTAAAQNAAGSAVNSINSALSPFGRHINTNAAATAVATGQRVLLPSGTTLNFTLSQPPAPSSAPSPVPAAQSAPAAGQTTASATPAPAPPTPSASARSWYTLCRYQGQQDGHQIVYVTPFIHTDLAASDISTAFNKYMGATYDIMKIQQGSGYCSTKVSDSADQRTYTMQQLEKQWADSKTVVTHINWTGTPDEIAATNAKLAAADAAGPAPNEKYVYCMSGGTGPTVYFSDIFAAVPTSPTTGPHSGRNGFPEFSEPFLAFLQNKYGYKNDPSSPTTCRAVFNPNPAGLHAAQTTKQAAQDLDKQANKQIVETGWKK